MRARWHVVLLATLAIPACDASFALFDPAAPALDARFAADSAGPGLLPITRQFDAGDALRLIADTLIFAPDGQVTRRWHAWHFYPNNGHTDSSLSATTWTGQYDFAGPRLRLWLLAGHPVLPESLTWVGDTALVNPHDPNLTTVRVRYRKVTP